MEFAAGSEPRQEVKLLSVRLCEPLQVTAAVEKPIHFFILFWRFLSFFFHLVGFASGVTSSTGPGATYNLSIFLRP